MSCSSRWALALSIAMGVARPVRNDDVPLREEIVPIREIAITFDPRYRFRSIRVEPEGRNLEIGQSDAGARVVVPQLEVHAIVAGELAATASK